MSPYRRPDVAERTLWAETAEKGDRGVIFSKFGNEKLEKTGAVQEFGCDEIDRQQKQQKQQKQQSLSDRPKKVGPAKKSKEDDVWSTTTLDAADGEGDGAFERVSKSESTPTEKGNAARRTRNKHEQGKKSPSSVFASANISSSSESSESLGDGEDEDTVQKVADSTKFRKEEGKISHQKYSKNTLTTTKTEAEENENENEAEKTKRQSIADVGKEKEREFRRQKVLERVQRVAEILALTPTTRTTAPTLKEDGNINEEIEDDFLAEKEQERVALSLIDEEDNETELYSKVAALRLQLRRYKELASAAQKRNEEWETERLELTKETNELKIERFKLKSCLDVISAQQQVQESVESSPSNCDREEEEEEENSNTSEKARKAKAMSVMKNEVLENATLEMENAAKANVTANNRSVQAMREAQRLEDELLAYKESSREEIEALMIEASRSRIRAREFKRELENSEEKFTTIEKDLRAKLTETSEEHEMVMDEKDKRMQTLRLRLEEMEKRNTFLESKNEELEAALENDAGAYYGAQLRKVREAHEEMLSREQVKLERVKEDLRIEKEKAAENRNEFENIKRALAFRTSENEKDDTAAWSNALGLNDMNNDNATSSSSSPSSPSSAMSSPTCSVAATVASAMKKLQMRQQRIQMQDSLLRMARDEIKELRDVNKRLLERQTSRCNSTASLYRSDSVQAIPTVPSSRASSRPLSRTSSRNNDNFNAFDDHHIPEDDELSLEARELLNSPYYCGASPHKKNRGSGEKLCKTDSTVSLSLRETANGDVNLAPLGSWASFEGTATFPKSDDCNRGNVHTGNGDLSLTHTTNATSEEGEEKDEELAHNSRKLQAFFEKRANSLSRNSSTSSRLTEHRDYSTSKALEMSIKEGEAVMRSVNVHASRRFSRVSSDRYYDENGE